MTQGGRPKPHQHRIHSTMESCQGQFPGCLNGLACIVLTNHLVLIVSPVITLADLKAQRGRVTFQESSAVWWPVAFPLLPCLSLQRVTLLSLINPVHPELTLRMNGEGGQGLPWHDPTSHEIYLLICFLTPLTTTWCSRGARV